MLTLQELKTQLAVPHKIVITTHHKPDGDALGSALGLYAYLIQKGHQVQVITPSDYPTFLHWMPNNDKVVIFPEHVEAASASIAAADFIFCLDFNHLSRIHEMGPLVEASAAKKIMIDHHLEPADFDSFRHWDTRACATAQLVYDFIANLFEDADLINADVATCLYTGIMTDSASFRFETAGAAVYRIAADLIDKGAPHAKIHEWVYDSVSEQRLRLLGYCLSEKLEVLADFNTAIIALTKVDLDQFKVITGDTEGIVNYALSIHGIKLAALIIERPDRVKLSLRSKDVFPANEICKFYFSGGGHRNAAGGSSEKPLEEVVKEFKSILIKYKEQLLS